MVIYSSCYVTLVFPSSSRIPARIRGDRLRANCGPLPKPNTAKGASSASSRIHAAGATAAGLLYLVENRVLVVWTRTKSALTHYRATVNEEGHAKTVDLA